MQTGVRDSRKQVAGTGIGGEGGMGERGVKCSLVITVGWRGEGGWGVQGKGGVGKNTPLSVDDVS